MLSLTDHLIKGETRLLVAGARADPQKPKPVIKTYKILIYSSGCVVTSFRVCILAPRIYIFLMTRYILF
jgi:hypothetical protein